MYIPDIFKHENPDEIREFLMKNAFGILVNTTNGRLLATHIPIELETVDGKDVLRGHIAIENPQALHLEGEALAIFTGAHSYISSSWYDFESVPTWNYSAVHVYGNIRKLDESELLGSLKKLVDKYEAASENPVSVEKFSRKTMMQTRAIAGFEIEITEIQSKRKLSQNRDGKNLASIINELQKTGNPNSIAVADAMSKCPMSVNKKSV